jgi:hypothetical protein
MSDISTMEVAETLSTRSCARAASIASQQEIISCHPFILCFHGRSISFNYVDGIEPVIE